MGVLKDVLGFCLRFGGDLVECGVGGGSSAHEILDYCGGRRCWFYDTFIGFPMETWAGDGPLKVAVAMGEHARKAVADSLRARGGEVVAGVVPDVIGADPGVVCFVHLDLDTRYGIRGGLETFWPRLSVGGSVLVHDYFGASNQRWDGVRIAVDEFVAGRSDVAFLPHPDELYCELRKVR